MAFVPVEPLSHKVVEYVILVPYNRKHLSLSLWVLSSLLRFVWAPNAPRQFSLTGPDLVKVIEIENAGAQVFDLFADPRETRPLSPAPTASNRALAEVLARQAETARRFTQQHGPVAPGVVTQDDIERLRALGYLEPLAAP